MSNNLTLTNIQIKNKIKNFKDWYESDSWGKPLLNGETVYIRITGKDEDDVTINYEKVSDIVASGLPIGIYAKTGDGATNLRDLPWNNNALEITSSVAGLRGDLDLLNGSLSAVLKTEGQTLTVGSDNYNIKLIGSSTSYPTYNNEKIILMSDVASDSSNGLMSTQDYGLLHELAASRIIVTSSYSMPTISELSEGAIAIIVAES